MRQNLLKRMTMTQILLLGIVISVLIGCSTTPAIKEPEILPQRPVSEFVKEDVTSIIDANDPLEGWNRRIYRFNARFDEYDSGDHRKHPHAETHPYRQG